MKRQLEILARTAALVLAILLFGSPVARAQVERVSIRSDGGQANDGSSGASASGDGNCVAFYSDATNLLPKGPLADTNAVRDVFVYDRTLDQLSRVSVSTAGVQANGPSQAQGFLPDVDGACTCVAFSSDATNLVDGDTNQRTDVFVRDLLIPETLRASVGTGGIEANGPSSFPSVSEDCRLIAFQSTASNLVLGDMNRVSDIFVHDRSTGETTRVSVGRSGEANGRNITPHISANGECVAFASAATNLLPGIDDTNGRMDIYVACGGVVTCRASVASDGTQANGDSFLPTLSADGRIVAFKSLASNLVANDRNGAADVFVHDCTTGRTEIISVSTRGEQSNDNSFPPSISGDGRFVAFGSFASNLAAGQSTGSKAHIYVRDRQANTTLLVSTNRFGNPGNGSAPDIPPSISLDGEFVAFSSFASDLVIDDTNEVIDAFIGKNKTATPTRTPTPTRVPTDATPTPISCTSTEDCPEGFECIDGICRQPSTPTPTATPIGCFIDLDCPLNHICIDGRCRQVRCTSNEDCAGGRQCRDGICQPIPITPTPLPTCTEDEDCILSCETAETCPPGRDCVENQCSPADRCRAMVCVPPRPCDDDDPDLGRINCRGDRETCVNNACECHGDCNLDGLVFGNEISRMVCVLGGNEECPLSSCLAGDQNQDGEIVGSEVCAALTNLGLGCPGEGLPLELRRDRSIEMRSVVIGSATAGRGRTVDIGFELQGGGEVATVQFDLVFDTNVLRIDNPALACRVAPGLTATHASYVFLPHRPAVPEGKRRLRLFIADMMLCQDSLESPVDSFPPGPFLTCTFQVRPDAPLGVSELLGERLNVGDARGNEFGASLVSGSVTVVSETCDDDSDCPVGTHCRASKCIPIQECSAPGTCAGGRREACVNGRCECTGDCNLDGNVFGTEITRARRILLGELPIEECPAADQNGDGDVFATEVTLGRINLLEGCPLGEAP